MIPIAKPYLTEDEAQAAYDTILSGWITQGPRVAEFEEKFAAYTGAKYAVAVSNCTTALHLAMIVAGVQAGDEVICPSMSFIATANCIKYVNAEPVFAEVNKSYNLDIKDVENRINKKTKAILLVHQLGMPANIDAFSALAKKYNLKLIEDAACAAGSAYKGKKIGTHSELVCFSFHPRKVISTGDGGMITTSNEADYERMKLLRHHGMSVNDRERYVSKSIVFEEYLEIGYNYRMTDIQAAVGIRQLEKLNWLVEERRKVAGQYIAAFKNIKGVHLPVEEEGYFSNYQTFSIYLDPASALTRNDLMQKMLDAGIATRRTMTTHTETAYKYLGLSLPISEDFADNSICLPLYVPMSGEDIQKVISIVNSLLNA